MNCEEVRKSIGVLHDGAAGAGLKNQLENHIAGCSSCRAAFDRLQSLSVLLQKDVLPLPSPSLERKLMQAFRAKHERPVETVSWWKTIFAGSVSVPKPVFAAALMAVTLALITANLIGRRAVITTAGDTDSIVQSSTSPQSPLPTETVERTKIVEIPIIKERLITKTIYIERENVNVNKTAKKFSGFNTIQTTAVNKKSNAAPKFPAPKLQMSGSIAENGYYTQTNLSDFEPIAETRIRIIRKEKTDEK